MSKKEKNKRSRGFYLVETILAMFLVTIGLLAAISLLTSTMKGGFEDRDNITAVLLSQEGIELVRNLRDNNFAQGLEAFDGANTGFPNSSHNHCHIDYDDPELTCNNAAGNSESKRLYLNGWFYGHTGTYETRTKFFRRIGVDYNGNGTTSPTMTVYSIVGWGGSLPTDVLANCTVANKCVYSSVIFTRWAE
jgi:competence protein ComGC